MGWHFLVVLTWTSYIAVAQDNGQETARLATLVNGTAPDGQLFRSQSTNITSNNRLGLLSVQKACPMLRAQPSSVSHHHMQAVHHVDFHVICCCRHAGRLPQSNTVRCLLNTGHTGQPHQSNGHPQAGAVQQWTGWLPVRAGGHRQQQTTQPAGGDARCWKGRAGRHRRARPPGQCLRYAST